MVLAENKSTDAEPFYCRRCDYELTGLPAPRCPECGRSFDPANARTFRRRRGRTLGRRLLRFVLFGFAGVLVLLAAAAGVYYWQYTVHERVIAEVKAEGWAFKTARVLPAWLDGRLRQIRLPAIRSVITLDVGQAVITDADLDLIGQLTHLRDLSFNGAGVTDAGARQIMKLQDLVILEVFGSQITDEGLVGLDRLQRLKVLDLFSSRISDKTLAQIAWLQGLDRLGIANTDVTDAGLAQLTGLSKLAYLDLYSAAIGDPAMEHIARLSNLRALNLSGTGVTDRGIERLRQLKYLRELGVTSTQMTGAGVGALRDAFTGLTVEGP